MSKATLHRVQFDRLFGINKPVFSAENGSVSVKSPASDVIRSTTYAMPRFLYLSFFIDRLMLSLTEAEPAHRDPNRVAAILRYARGLAWMRGQDLLVLSDLGAQRHRDTTDLLERIDIDHVNIAMSEAPEPTVFGNTDRHWPRNIHRFIAERLKVLFHDAERSAASCSATVVDAQ